jgi:hypothetical protein
MDNHASSAEFGCIVWIVLFVIMIFAVAGLEALGWV